MNWQISLLSLYINDIAKKKHVVHKHQSTTKGSYPGDLFRNLIVSSTVDTNAMHRQPFLDFSNNIRVKLSEGFN